MIGIINNFVGKVVNTVKAPFSSKPKASKKNSKSSKKCKCC